MEGIFRFDEIVNIDTDHPNERPNLTVRAFHQNRAISLTASSIDCSALEYFMRHDESAKHKALQRQFIGTLTKAQRELIVKSFEETQKPAILPTAKFRHNFHWRGRETGEGEIQVDTDGSNKGYIEFTDSTYTVFHGMIYIPFAGDVHFSGYKTSGLIGPIEDEWEDYSEAAHRYAEVARWR